MEYTAKSAILSKCGRYRYLLSRRWKPGKTVLFVMLNPSTADGLTDDPTVRKCVGFADRLGHGAVLVVNLFAYRATDPADLAKAGWDVGVETDDYIRMALSAADLVIFAWGAHAKLQQRRIAEIRVLVREAMALGFSADGSPRHPLMLSYSTLLQPCP